ncbi:HtaA domain-containing protein [Streptomyces sp. NPDC007088]|uniref:HtaA domain-containing protein n=1 Tax=Streptomyces sp. NPDC007088 TaxID=3364773 RepID=UPI0036CA0315
MAATRRRRPTALAAAVATAVTLGATALALPGAFAADASSGPPASIGLKDATLDWGVKKSFRTYLLSPVANGKITVGDGVRQAAGNGPFTFSGGTGTYDTQTHGTRTSFGGSVHFEGHEGVLDITLTDVKVTTTTTGGGISADVTTVKDGKSTTDDDVVLADLALSGIRPGGGAGGAMVYQDIPATLTARGAAAFQNFYKAGAELDPATLSVTPEAAGGPTGKPTDDPTSKPTGTPTGKPTDEPSGKPTQEPTGKPTQEPTGKPTEAPTGSSSAKPTDPPGGSSAPSTGPGQKPAEGITKGSLTWGLKESFRSYVETGGGAELAGGAQAKNGVYDFPYASGTVDPEGERADVAFGGSVRFTYQAHGIDMRFSDIKIDAKGPAGTLTLDVTTPQGAKDDVEFAKLDLSRARYTAKNDLVVLDRVPATFTAAGAAAFANDTTGSMYKAGQAIDPVTVTLALSDAAALPTGTGGTGTHGGTGTDAGTGTTGGTGTGTGFGTTGGTGTGFGATGGSLASTGSGLPAGPLLGGAGAVVAAGAGAVYLSRRRRTAQS